MKIAILGFGLEGESASEFLKIKYPKAQIEIRDKKFGENYLQGLDKFNLIVRSPGIKYLTPEIQKAKKRGVEISSPTKLFFKFKKGTIIGVTGTKGKGTTSTFIYSILKKSGKDVYLAGNIGYPALDILPKLNKDSVAVLELSSFQLQDLVYSPEVAVVLGIAPDHLDSHKNMREYVAAKSNIALHQKKNNAVFFIKNDKYSKWISQKSCGQKFAIDTSENSEIASCVARFLGCKEKHIKSAIKNFPGLRQHQEFIKEISGVRFYNDSASTNPVSTAYAIDILTPEILIAGGKTKGFSYSWLRKTITQKSPKKIILFGENKYEIKKALGEKVSVKIVDNLSEAVRFSYEFAERGDVILFSPGSASFDQFKNSKERGEEFNKLVRELKKML
ncbi:MAG: UDP-N-acetylmuramoyl-L-alanine--D-glutamate ligase [Patescibacteria group bacterium]